MPTFINPFMRAKAEAIPLCHHDIPGEQLLPKKRKQKRGSGSVIFEGTAPQYG
jgi:hypothetical protein